MPTPLSGQSRDTSAAPNEAFENQLLRSYARWIEYNAQVRAVNDILVTATVLLVIVSFAYVIAGVAVAAAGLLTFLTVVAFVGFIVLIGWLVRLAYHLDHLGTLKEEADIEAFSGVRLSKGATRAEESRALKRIVLGAAPPDEDHET